MPSEARNAVLILKEQIAGLLGSMTDSDFTLIGPRADEDRDAWLERNGKGIRAAMSSGNDRYDRNTLEKLPDLKRIVVFGTGMEGIDLAATAERGIVVSNAAGLNSGDVADHALAMMLAAHRRLFEGDALIRQGRWTSAMPMPLTRSLSALRIGIAGLGHIGTAIADRVAPLSQHIAWWGPRSKDEARWPRRATLLDLARDSDILFVAVRAYEDTRGIVDAAILDALGPKGLLVNVARGFVIDEPALIAALREGRLGQAALDVFDPEPTTPERWSSVPNVLLSPHWAGATSEALAGLASHAVESVRAFFAAEPSDGPATSRRS